MPYANNQGVRIHYEVEGEGPPLVLMHGVALSLEGWRQMSYAESLKNDYRLVLIDARGHGGSDKPHDPEAYRMALRVADVVAVLDDLKISKAHYLGYSMGGHIGYGIAKYSPDRFHSLIIVGAQPYDRDPEEPNFWLDLFSKSMDAYIDAEERMLGTRWTPALEAMCLANDLDALSALVSSEEQHDFEDVLPTVTVPCLLCVGEADDAYDGAKKASEIMPNATLVSFPGLDHVEAGCRSDLVVPHVRKFLAEVGEG